jgi:hypothetical protein
LSHEIIEQVKETLSNWNKFSSEVGINKKEHLLIEKTINESLKK